MNEEQYYQEKFESLERAIGKIETMLEKLMGKEEDRISRIVELEVKALQHDERIDKQKKDLDELWGKFKGHCYEHQGAAPKAIKAALTWVILVAGALGGVAAIVGLLVWWLKRLGVA